MIIAELSSAVTGGRPRFEQPILALFAVSQTNGSQRDLARWLGQTEPSTSRMVTVLANEGFLEVTRHEGAGNRRTLRLTRRGTQMVQQCSVFLEVRFEAFVQHSGVSYESYQRDTRRLLDRVDRVDRLDLTERRKPDGQGAA